MIKHFWFYVAFFLFFVFGVLGISIWQTDKISSFNKQAVDANVPTTALKPQVNTTGSLAELPDNAPGPAKILQKLLNHIEQPLTVDAALQEKIQVLDSKLVDIDAKLHFQGLSTADPTIKDTAPVAPDTQARLQNIKNHLKNK